MMRSKYDLMLLLFATVSLTRVSTGSSFSGSRKTGMKCRICMFLKSFLRPGHCLKLPGRRYMNSNSGLQRCTVTWCWFKVQIPTGTSTCSMPCLCGWVYISS